MGPPDMFLMFTVAQVVAWRCVVDDMRATRRTNRSDQKGSSELQRKTGSGPANQL